MYAKYIKRLLDIVLSVIALPFALMISLVLIPCIYFEDKGSPFYNAPRLGKDGKIFIMYKFRSMKVNAPDIRNADGSTFNSDNDPRVTKVGRFIRKTSLDEIPQIINVLKGDMSFIGPRPDLPDALKVYTGNEAKRNSVRPGITGYSQAYFRNNIELRERFRQDVYYAENVSFALDFKIFVKTIGTVLRGRNVYRNGSEKTAANPKKDQKT